MIVGGVLSFIVTVVQHVAVFPLASVTFRMTDFVPTSQQLKVFGVTVIVNEQLSVDPLSTCEAVSVTEPLLPM